ncbi:MAG: GNAT family N-acetyltransferase [Actinomycetota bacterium]|nr:GNAT family N-acetyltransferase [Acidimicrobiales bacterium]MEC8983366.1 GNAT family N-acetyltransferase [Actinomycetota bacterium]MEC9425645.1 GNAT family N-acetyltransferase [Actinomycetota bacterium]MEC9450463.1 GNAT family N-acetyltransferase [Actinomycetota bacterium]MED5165894.1 GNAT family N-acetyltransferase [Actinomycetota bacterium]
MEIRLARPGDAEAIRAIYNHEVTTSTATFDLVERSSEDQQAWLAARAGAFSVLVAEIDDDLAGFASLSPFRERAAYRSTVENSVYVAADHRGRGVADRLLENLLEVARTSGFHSVIARIGGNNEASTALHTKHGFREVGVERQVGRKFGRWQDVTVMQVVFDDA